MLFFFAIAVIGINLFALPIFIWLLKRSVQASLLFLGAMIIANVVTTVDVALTMGGGFGTGTVVFLVSCLSAPLAVIPLSVYLFLRRKHFARAVGDDTLKRRLYVVGGILLIALPFTPAAGTNAMSGYCDGQIEQAGNPIVQAMNQYRQANGYYPSTMDTLVPAYLGRVPTAPSCLGKDNKSVKYEIQTCSESVTLLTAKPSFDDADDLRYNFATGNWSGISFLDGACNFLR
jgi:hypothetical protein